MSINTNDFQAGRLKLFVNEWRKLTSDKYILDAVQHCYIEFTDNRPPIQNKMSIRNSKFNLKEEKIVDIEIEKLLKMNVIQEVESEINEFISPIFVRPKKNGEYRMILNLKELNKHIEYQHFKMDSFESALNLIKENAYMSSVDLRHAYYSINIAEQHRKFLRFVWKEKYFQYSCLPNGIAMAPRLFTKIMKVVYASLRKMGYVNVGYIDDSLLLGDTELECKNNVTETVNMVSSLGFIVHKDKSVFTPKKCIKFLGFYIDSETMIVTLPVEKQDTIAKECKQLQSKNKCKIREVARVLGILISSLPAVEFGKLYYRKIEREKIKALKLAMGDFDSEMFVTSEMKQDLKWWSDNIYTQKRKFNRGNPQVIIQTDASKLGWGAVLNEQKIGSRWSNDEKDNHINCLELLAVYYALKSFKDDLNTVENVKILTDNTTAVSYINSMGGIKSIECNRIARKIWIWCIEHQIWLIATHIPGKLNTKADYQSRNFNDQIEWQLNKNNFEKVCLLWNKPEIDLFASHLNTQLPIFCSWKADPESSFVDAFTLDWGNFSYSYMFPPFSMIGRCVKKIIKDKADVLFVGPLWPTQPWFVQVMKLLINNPYVIKANKKLLTLPYKDIVHPLEKTLNLMVCRISGTDYKTEEFQRKLPLLSWHHGDQELKNNIKHISRNGLFSVLNGKRINFTRL